MIWAIAALLTCQLVGEVIARGAGLPVPGPVIGLGLLLVALAIRRNAPKPLEALADGLLRHLSLLFVPAGVGVMVHFARIEADWPTMAATLIISTAVTLAVTVLVFGFVARMAGVDRDGD